MDIKTKDFYNNNAMELYYKYNSVLPDYIKTICNLLKPGNSVLDIGAGSGRDLISLYSHNFNIYGIEPSKELIKIFNQNNSNLNGRIVYGNIPNNFPESFLSKTWDCILMTAVLQHLNDNELVESITLLKTRIKESGYLVLSIPITYPGIINNRDKNGRLFIVRSTTNYIDLLFEAGFILIEDIKYNDALKRNKIVWKTLIFQVQ